MMKIFRFLFSGTFMGALLIVFAYAIGYATFIENDFDATTAKIFVYNARWFEFLLLLMILNFSGMIVTKKLYLKSQLNVLFIHLALIIIIFGAGITRYIGYEGMMHIRNGQTTNKFLTTDNYFTAEITDGSDNVSIREKVMLSSQVKNFYNEEVQIGNQAINLSIENYYENAVETLVRTEGGSPYISLIIGFQDGRHELLLKEGESKVTHNLGFSFGDTTNNEYAQIIRNDGLLFIKFPNKWTGILSYAESELGSVQGFDTLGVMEVQSFQNTQFVLREFLESGKVEYGPAKTETGHTMKMAKLNINNEDVFIEFGKLKQIRINNLEMNLYLGPQEMELPFSLKLNEFQVDRYPGSNSPSSFASEITLIDERIQLEKPYRIFMNNVLSYGGFRFYQSSYDQDEKGTILSVNHDYWGTVVTYFGYFLLFATLLISFFTRKTRFHRLLFLISDIHEKRKKLVASLAILILSVFSVNNLFGQEVEELAQIDKAHAAKFGRLMEQDQGGRIMPVNTRANEILIKIYKKGSFEGQNAEQVLLSVMMNGTEWAGKPIIKVNHDAVQSMLGIQDDLGSYNDFFNEEGNYKLAEVVDQAFKKKPALRNTYDKELIKVNERLMIYHQLLQGSRPKILPVKDAPNDTWFTPVEYRKISREVDGLDYRLFDGYLLSLREARMSDDYSEADKKLDAISQYQREIAQEIVPSERKIDLEIFYNETNIFKTLFPVYLTLGIFLVGIFFIQIIKPELSFMRLTTVFFGLLFLAFFVQTIGLILRWYISGHAPWSNGYESMIYISWATMLAGFLFMKKSPITLALTSLLAGITLLTAHMSWMDPEITNLVPVLKSYWLTIHVATITASYGFLALASLMGFFNLCLMIFRTEDNLPRLNLALKELSLIIELSLMCGIVLLVIGNFLGGIWANESWGRYWGWDPKETWTLVTIIVYSFILHMGLIPGLKNLLITNFLSLMGFGTVLMTYFGVNYYLSGLHSYAAGDPVPVPTFVYYTLAVIGIVTVLAAFNQNKLKHKMEELQ